jgi:CubicO group peptidase (beta-lactamase class C family)
MKFSVGRTVVSACCLCLLALSWLPLPTAAARHVDMKAAPDFARIDAYVNTQVQDARIPGLALGIIHGDQIAHLYGFGAADSTGSAVTPQTPFLLGSTTKSFTALAIMQLVEAGKIDLDAPVQRYLPWFRVADPVASAHITVRHLLTQVSGLSTSVGLQMFTDSPAETPEQYVRNLSTVTLTKPVGATFQYSNANYAILGLIVQVVSGAPFETYLQQHVLDPLQMHRSFVSREQAKRAGLAQGHRSWFGFPVPIDLPPHPAAFAAGFLISSAEDMAHYLIAQSNGGRYNGVSLLSPQGIDTMHTFASRSQYAMGWSKFSQNGEMILYHNGDTLDSHSEMFLAPAQHWGVVLLLNEGDAIGAVSPIVINRAVIGKQILRMLEGQALAPARWSTNTIYLFLDGILALLFALVLVNAVLLPRWYKRFQQPMRYRGIRVGGRLLGELLLPALILIGVPALGGYSWEFILLAVPDLGWWMLVTMSLLLVTGVLRGALVYSTLRHNKVDLVQPGPLPV